VDGEIRNDIRKLSDQLNIKESERSLAVNFHKDEKELRSLKNQLERCEQRKPKAEREVTMEQLVTGKDPSLVKSICSPGAGWTLLKIGFFITENRS